MTKSKSLNFIDLFSGCGGFSYGMEMAGHRCQLGIDFNEAAVKSFAQNHPHAHALHMDIHQLTKAKLESLVDVKKIDMVIGGPPCQGFSTAGRGKSDDLRNSLFKEFVRIVKITDPKIVLFENVTGILAQKNTKVLSQIFASFEKLGYSMSAKVMSADEYGVPSRRRRTIIMGVKGGSPSYPLPTHGSTRAQKLITVQSVFKNFKARDGKVYNHDVAKAAVTNEMDRERLKCIPDGKGIRYEKDEKTYLPKKLRYNIDWATISEGRFRQTRLQRLALTTPAPTILTSRTTYYHPIEPRYLTCREAASLQSFPNDFIFVGPQTEIFRQIGNAVPPVLACAIGEHLKSIKFTGQQKRIKLDDLVNIKKKAFTYIEKEHARETL